LFGSLERFTGILIEHYAGHLPLWLSPVQVVVATITSDSDDYGYEVIKELKSLNLRTEIDARNEKIGYKIREHSNSKIPIIIAIGKKEAEERSVSVRRLGSQETKTIKLDEIKNILQQESKIPSA
jgi:threonyl-tRNA synthetase